MEVQRGSMYENTWTIDHDLISKLSPGDTLKVINKRQRSHIYSYEEVIAIWEKARLRSSDGRGFRNVHFPWHPLEQ